MNIDICHIVFVQSLAEQSIGRANRGEGGPPPFVPFGKKIRNESAHSGPSGSYLK